MTPELPALDATERDCLLRYCAQLRDRLGPRLVLLRLFGSAARGDLWPAGSPMHSDLDLLVVTTDELDEAERDELGALTYPLYLECGRQISPQLLTAARLAAPDTDVLRELLAAVERDGVPL